MKIFYWCFAGLFMFLAVDFAISNQGLVELTLWPLPGSVTVPIFILAFGVFTVSFFAGGFVAWVGRERPEVVRVRQNVRSGKKSAKSRI